MKKSQIAAQLYSFRDFIKTPEGVKDTFRILHEMGYEAVQLSSSLAEMPEEKLADLLAEYSLSPCSAHENGADIINKTEKVIEKLKKLHCSHLAYPGPHVNVTGEGEARAFARLLDEKAGEFASAGITLAYHNHHVEFKRFGSRTLLELIYENAPGLEGELDTHWIQRGGGDPVKWIRMLAGRMQVLHVKDYGVDSADRSSLWNGKPVMMPVGYGNLDWRGIFGTADAAGVKWYVVEHDADVDDPFESFRKSLKFITDNFAEQTGGKSC